MDLMLFSSTKRAVASKCFFSSFQIFFCISQPPYFLPKRKPAKSPSIAPRETTPKALQNPNTPALARKPAKITRICPGKSAPKRGRDSINVVAKIIRSPQYLKASGLFWKSSTKNCSIGSDYNTKALLPFTLQIREKNHCSERERAQDGDKHESGGDVLYLTYEGVWIWPYHIAKVFQGGVYSFACERKHNSHNNKHHFH